MVRSTCGRTRSWSAVAALGSAARSALRSSLSSTEGAGGRGPARPGSGASGRASARAGTSRRFPEALPGTLDPIFLEYRASPIARQGSADG